MGCGWVSVHAVDERSDYSLHGFLLVINIAIEHLLILPQDLLDLLPRGNGPLKSREGFCEEITDFQLQVLELSPPVVDLGGETKIARSVYFLIFKYGFLFLALIPRFPRFNRRSF